MAVAQDNARATRLGGVTGSGFLPGRSGNPGGRPKGLSRRVRDLVGADGEAIAVYMLSVMRDETARTADRLEAAKWLADGGFGRTVQTLDFDITAHPPIDVTQLSTPDLEALIDIFGRYRSNARELVTSGERAFEVSTRSGSGAADVIDPEALMRVQEASYAQAGRALRGSWPRESAMDAAQLESFSRSDAFAFLPPQRRRGTRRPGPSHSRFLGLRSGSQQVREVVFATSGRCPGLPSSSPTGNAAPTEQSPPTVTPRSFSNRPGKCSPSGKRGTAPVWPGRPPGSRSSPRVSSRTTQAKHTPDNPSGMPRRACCLLVVADGRLGKLDRPVGRHVAPQTPQVTRPA
jgi:hypothetical protein